LNNFSTLTSSITSKALIAANIIPLIGVIFFEWDLRFILVLYWIENIVIGIFNLFKMLSVSSDEALAGRLGQCAFFTIHYGGFCAAHGLFLLSFLDIPLNDLNNTDSSSNPISLVISSIKPTFDHLYNLFGIHLILAISALFVSHGFSLIENFFAKGEKNILTMKKLFSQPYPRIIVMHVTIIVGGILVQKLGSPIFMLAALICLKIVIDLMLHRREHKSIQTEKL